MYIDIYTVVSQYQHRIIHDTLILRHAAINSLTANNSYNDEDIQISLSLYIDVKNVEIKI